MSFFSRNLFRLYMLGQIVLLGAVMIVPLVFVYGWNPPVISMCFGMAGAIAPLICFRYKRELSDVRDVAEPMLRLQHGERVVRAVAIPERRDWLFTVKAADGTRRQVEAQAQLRAVLPPAVLGWLMSLALVLLVSWGFSHLLSHAGFPWGCSAKLFSLPLMVLGMALFLYPCRFLLTYRFRSMTVWAPTPLLRRFVEVVGYVATDEDDTSMPELPAAARSMEERGYLFYYLSDPEAPRKPDVRELKARPIARGKVHSGV